LKKNIIKIFIILISFFLVTNSYANKSEDKYVKALQQQLKELKEQIKKDKEEKARAIVYIDMDYILNQSIKGKNISQILENENKTKTDKLNEIEENLNIEEKKIISKKNLLNDDEFRKLIQEFQIKINNFNSEKKIAINLLNKKKISLTKDFINQINPIFIEFAQKNSISIILKKKDIIMGDSNLDKTLELLKLVNEKINDK